LLILDNCEHLVEACASLVEGLLLACPRLRILVTSREALGIASESLLPIPSLSLPDLQLLARKPGEHLPLVQDSEAARLFVERAGRVQPGFRLTESNSLPIAQVCRRLDGIPLAIELAAARARVLSVEQILARLDERFLLLTGGSRTALPRQQTLQALVDWSYDLLSEPERRLFRRLSVFAGGWTLEAAEAVCAGGEIESRQVLDLLTRLVDKSLVVAEPGEGGRRFRLLETIRQYAQERRRADGPEDDLPRRHFDYYSNLVEESEKGLTGPDTSAWLKLLDAEKDNVYAALTWAAQAGAALQGDPRDADLADAAQFMAGRMWEFWLARGALSEGRHWLELTLRSGDRRGSPRAKALVSAGIMSWQQGDYAEAFRWLDESISILRELEPPDQPGLANATHMLGHAALDQNDFTTATQAFQESLELYRALDDQYYVGTLISDLGMVAYHQGDYRAARLYQEESLAVFQKHGNSEIIAQTMHRLGELARLEEDYDRAEEYYESCLSTYREIGIQLDIASNLHKLGYIAQRKGDFELARARFTESLSIQRQAGNKQGMIECLAGLAGLAAATGQPTRALRLYGAAQAWLDSTGMPLAPADLVEWQRDQTLACGQLDEAACLQAQAEGRLMTAEQAMEYALSGGE
jgi:non-specific serine/threonine protein kinase